MSPAITIFGGSGMKPGSNDYEQAVELGRRLGEAGFDVVTGGFGGAMEAASRGVKETGGRAVGVTMGFFAKAGNRYLDEEITTDDFWSRTRAMLDRSVGVVCLPGSTGTLAELAVTWELIYKGFTDVKPLALVGDFWRPLVEALCPTPDAPAWCEGALRITTDAAETVAFLVEFLGREELRGRRGFWRRTWRSVE